jgi:hypothetical protein
VSPVFADTFYFLALFNPRDHGHARAVHYASNTIDSLVTTDWVLTETGDALADPVNREGCVEFIDDLRVSASVDIVPASRELFDAGWDMYRNRLDKGWSLTDCISFVVMQRRDIREALTGDHHFEQAGFQALLTDSA